MQTRVCHAITEALRRLIPASLLCCFLTACGDPAPPQPVITPSVSQQTLDELVGVTRGPYPVSEQQFTLERETGRDVPLRIFYSECGPSCPVVVFSHGFGSGNSEYSRVLRHWASHGMVVVAANHADSGGLLYGIFSSLRYGQLGLMEVRIADLKLVLDQLAAIAVRIDRPLDQQRIIAAGHSFGAFSAQQLIGAGAFNPETERMEYVEDPRILAAVALSPPGPMFDQITEQSWKQVRKPMLITTGTRDAEPRFWPDWRIHKLSFETSLPGSKYALVVEGADHYLGNLICRTDNEAEPQTHALMMVNAVSTVFISAQFAAVEAGRGNGGGLILSANYLHDLTKGFATVEIR